MNNEIIEKLPFSLKAAKEGAELITRTGQPARLICADCQNEAFANGLGLVALVTLTPGNEEPVLVELSGKLHTDRDSSTDLFIRNTYKNLW